MSASGGNVWIRLIRSFERPPRRIVRLQVAHGRLSVGGEGPSLREERLQALRHRLRGLDQRIHFVERRAQVHERRVGAAHERREPSDRLGQRLLLAAERARGLVEVADQAREVVAALGERGDHLGAVDEEALEHRRVAGQLVEEAAGGGERRVQVLEADVRLVAPCRATGGRALEEALEGAPGLRVERVEELVEVDLGDGLVGVDQAAVRDLCRPCPAGASGRRSGWRGRTGRTGGSPRACRAGAASGRRRSTSRSRRGRRR